MLFGTSNNPMCHIFLILFYVYISCLNHIFLSYYFFLRQFNHCLTGNAFYHIQHIITNTICQWLIPQQPNKTTPPMVSQCLHPSDPAAPQPPANLLTSRSLVAACRPKLVLAIAARQLVSDSALINTPPTVRTKKNKGKHSLLQLVKYNSCRSKATTLRNG
jgi:hypothetical protein